MANSTGIRASVRQRMGTVAVAGLAGLTGLALPSTARAGEGDDAKVEVPAATESGETIDVTGSPRRRAASTKYTAPLLDTPQTITVIDQRTIRGQNLLTLREILSTAPGITFGAGEGGGGYGDSINLRGYAANTDITIDGVRDSAQYTRSDPFNLDHIELVNGANSVYGGSGSLGGSVNIVSKTPKGTNRTVASAAVGTDNYYRGTVDADYMVADGIAVRLNAMGHTNDVPRRDEEYYHRWGVAPSIAFGLGSPTEVTLSYFHQRDDNIPQYGVPYYKNAFNNGPLPGADPSSYYGYRNIDLQNTTVDRFTAEITHDFSDWLSVRNLTRWQDVEQSTVVDPPQAASICLPNGLLASSTAALNGTKCAYTGTYIPTGPRGNRRDTDNTLLYNETDFSAQFDTGFIKHSAVFGFSFSHEEYHLDTGPTLRNPNGTFPNGSGTTYSFPAVSILDPDSLWTGPVNFIRTGISDGGLDDRAIYLFDTMELSPQWEINAGIRYERVEGEFTAAALPVAPAAGSVPPFPLSGPNLIQGPVFRSDDDLLSYRAGIVYKPVPQASIYFAYGNTETPSQASVNGGCVAATCSVAPEKGKVYEFGVKWAVLDNRLNLSASVFQNDRSNYKVASNDPTLPDQQLDGSARVRGVTLSATGNITDDLTIFANYTYLDTEVIQGVSNFCVANPAVAACATAIAANGGVAGNPLLNTPANSGSLWMTYKLPYDITVGYGVSYQGSFYLNNGLGPLFKADDYWLHTAMISYQADDDFLIQLNVKNVTDETYYTRIRNNGWALPGDGASAQLSATYSF